MHFNAVRQDSHLKMRHNLFWKSCRKKEVMSAWGNRFFISSAAYFNTSLNSYSAKITCLDSFGYAQSFIDLVVIGQKMYQLLEICAFTTFPYLMWNVVEWILMSVCLISVLIFLTWRFLRDLGNSIQYNHVFNVLTISNAFNCIADFSRLFF